MRRSSHTLVAALLTGALLAGCQTTTPPSTAARPKAHRDGPTRVVAEKRGWTVELVTAEDRDRAYCLAQRKTAAPALVFVAAVRDSGFRLTGLPPAEDADSARALTALFDDGERVPFQAHPLDDRALMVAFPTADYEDALYPFARSRRVEFHNGASQVASFSLSGSSWAINAADECRRMHTGS
ncbi:MAG TPA: hypothetical protein VD995_23020 [Azospirillum sp.]|nr:hypothetical protein [Azospirillum sp.]